MRLSLRLCAQPDRKERQVDADLEELAAHMGEKAGRTVSTFVGDCRCGVPLRERRPVSQCWSAFCSEWRTADLATAVRQRETNLVTPTQQCHATMPPQTGDVRAIARLLATVGDSPLPVMGTESHRYALRPAILRSPCRDACSLCESTSSTWDRRVPWSPPTTGVGHSELLHASSQEEHGVLSIICRAPNQLVRPEIEA